MNKRLLIALVLSFLVLTGYSYLMPQQKEAAVDVNNTATKVQTENKKENKDVHQAPTGAAKTIAPANVVATPEVPAIKNSKIIATVETNKYSLKIDSLGRMDSLILKDKKYSTEDGKPLDIISKTSIKPLEVRFKDTKLNTQAFKVDYTASIASLDAENAPAEITLTQNLGSDTITKVLKFYPDGNYDLSVKSSANSEYFITPGFRPTVDKSRYLVVRGALIKDAQGVITTLEKGDVDSVMNFNSAIVAAGEDRYYATVFYKKSGTFNATVAQSGVKDHEEEPVIFVNVKGSDNFLGYAGPKEWKLFKKLDKNLEDVIEFGWFTFLSRPFFKVMYAIYNFVGNWGWAIVLFTLLVKLILFPLSYKGLMSMQKLKDLAPKMKELKEKHGKDPAKMNQMTMQLYKKHGANPMGGCLPMLLQIPIFFALYRVLLNADELQGAPWIGWITDLSHQDPYYVLPVLMGITMFIQQKVTPNTMTDPTQKKIFQFLPVIMTFFFLTFPAGLVLYWLVNNTLTIAQQYYINHAYENYKKKMKAIKNSSE